jgi:HEAT repeat protein
MVESVEALAKLDPKRAVAPIIEYGMKSSHPDVVRRSITTLKRLDPKEAVQPIIDYGLKSSRIDLIIPSVKALEEIGDPRALPRLMMLADHEDKDVRGDVKTAIRRIRGTKHA